MAQIFKFKWRKNLSLANTIIDILSVAIYSFFKWMELFQIEIHRCNLVMLFYECYFVCEVYLLQTKSPKNNKIK